MNVGDLNKAWEVKALKKPGEEEAKKMLDQIAKQVQPIMRKRKWRVKVLSEFCPKNPALLGLNVARGVHVKLRLRRANRDWDFIPFVQECEELLSKGISGTGEGFDMPGKRLGGFSRQPPLSSLHKTALAAADKRAKLGSMLPSGPKRLGGDSNIMGALSPIQAAAMAAERRLRDEIWCASQFVDLSEDEEISTDIVEACIDTAKCKGSSIPNKSQYSRHGHQESKTNMSTCRPSFDVETKCQKRTCHSENASTSGSSFVDLTNDPSALAAPQHDSVHNTEEIAMWECGTCTLMNPPLAPICDLCCSEKPKDESSKYKTWACKFCTLDNSVKSDKCLACDQWRYSNGPPVSTRTPNLGT